MALDWAALGCDTHGGCSSSSPHNLHGRGRGGDDDVATMPVRVPQEDEMRTGTVSEVVPVIKMISLTRPPRRVYLMAAYGSCMFICRSMVSFVLPTSVIRVITLFFIYDSACMCQSTCGIKMSPCEMQGVIEESVFCTSNIRSPPQELG